MDLGKIRIALARSYNGDAEASLADLFLAFAAISEELAGSPGLALIPCVVAIARGQAVNIVNGHELRLADASLARPAIGICVAAAGIGQRARIVLGTGHAKGLAGLTANSSVYLGNAGALVFVKPASGFIQGLGFTLGTTEMFVTISQP